MTLASIGSINYTIDPLWVFGSKNKFNTYQYNINERQLKTNKLYFQRDESIDTLLLGSSRVSYINQNDFIGMNVFNFAEDDQYPFELNGKIEAAKSIQGKDFKYIIIGFDFIGASQGKWIQKHKLERPDQMIYLKKAQEENYRIKTLFGLDTLKYAFKNIQLSLSSQRHIVYSRDNVKYMYPYSATKKIKVLEGEYNYIKRNHYGTFVYDENITDMYNLLKDNNPRTKFIVFTTPVTAKLYELKNDLGLHDEYKRWLKELVENFGIVYDFTGINSVTLNPDNYRDVHHFDPRVGKLIVDRILEHNNSKIPNDFGHKLTKANVEQYLINIETRDSLNPSICVLE